MKVGLDYLPAVTHAPGVGRYARELVRALVRLEDRPELVLWEVGGGPRPVPAAALGLGPEPPRRVRSHLPRRWVGRALRLLRSGADRFGGGVDLFQRMQLDWPPVARARILFAVSELPADPQARDELRPALHRCDDFLVFSRSTEKRLEAEFGLEPGRVHRVPVGCDHWRRELGELPPRADPPLILVLGGVRRARHPVAVLRAFEALRERHPEARLLFVGPPGDGRAELEAALAASPARSAVRWQTRMEEAAMPNLVARAACLFHLSVGEETAVTPLEAFAVGTPVVASRLPAYEEDLAERARLVDTEAAVADPAAVARELEGALESAWDPAAVAAREAVGGRHSWAANARATLAVWRRLGSSGNASPSGA